MRGSPTDWAEWQQFFAARSGRPLPPLQHGGAYAFLPGSLARSLAIFQLGESGGGTIIGEARRSALPGVDAHYADAMALFVAEEHRHANILEMCVRMLGGELVSRNWTATLFVSVRRCMGLRLKVLVLLAAEVVGLCYYHLLAGRLPECPMKSWLRQIVDDERSHLEFHCSFLHAQVRSAWQRRLFVIAWRSIMLAAAVVVMIDHRSAIRDLGINYDAVLSRWMRYSRHAERQVTGVSAEFSVEPAH